MAWMHRLPQLASRLGPWQIALLAAFGYGGWSTLMNWEYGATTALSAGLVQGGYAFVSTAVLTLLARQILSLGAYSPSARWQALLVSYMVMFCLPFSIHQVNNTPDTLEAMLPGLLIGGNYLGWYCFKQQPS